MNEVYAAAPSLLKVFRTCLGVAADSPLWPWLPLAAVRGPTPRSGPLLHDLLLPTPDAPDRIGVNVFGHGSDAPIRALVDAHSPTACRPLLRAVQHARWNAGFYVDMFGLRLKLYLTGDLRAALTQWPKGLPPCQPMALGVDLTEDGPQRHRVYVMANDRSCAALQDGWSFATPMPWPPQHPAVSHGLLTAGVYTQKRTRNWIFRPDAPLSLLREALPSDHQLALDAVTAHPLPAGVVWAPVALEADSYADGLVSLDWLLTTRFA